jgi:sigma-E factor negative regulatory protein RseB
VTQQFSNWRVASAAAVFVLAGSSAVALAMHDRPSGSVISYQLWPKPSPSGPSSSGQRMSSARQTGTAKAGLRLMSQAAAACRSTAFSALLVSRWWGPSGNRVFRATVWHRPGGQTVAESVSGAAGPGLDPSAPVPSVSVIISSEQFTLLETGYVLDYDGRGTADGRQAAVVAVDRANGSLAARYWIDGQTKLPLRRQLFDDHSRLVSDLTLADLQLGPSSLSGMPAPAALPMNRPLDQDAIAILRSRGWPLPAALPGGMRMFAASQTPSGSGPIVGLSYSDGLSVISLFVQRGHLPAALPGWKRIAIAGHDAYTVDPAGQAVAWSADGYVYTVVADAPATSVDQAVDSLPHRDSPDFWTRLARGFRRLASWADPFH